MFPPDNAKHDVPIAYILECSCSASQLPTSHDNRNNPEFPVSFYIQNFFKCASIEYMRLARTWQLSGSNVPCFPNDPRNKQIRFIIKFLMSNI